MSGASRSCMTSCSKSSSVEKRALHVHTVGLSCGCSMRTRSSSSAMPLISPSHVHDPFGQLVSLPFHPSRPAEAASCSRRTVPRPRRRNSRRRRCAASFARTSFIFHERFPPHSAGAAATLPASVPRELGRDPVAVRFSVSAGDSRARRRVAFSTARSFATLRRRRRCLTNHFWKPASVNRPAPFVSRRAATAAACWAPPRAAALGQVRDRQLLPRRRERRERVHAGLRRRQVRLPLGAVQLRPQERRRLPRLPPRGARRRQAEKGGERVARATAAGGAE